MLLQKEGIAHRTFAAIVWVMQHEHVGMANPAFQDVRSAVIAAVIHKEELLIGIGRLQGPLQDALDGQLLVVDGHGTRRVGATY